MRWLVLALLWAAQAQAHEVWADGGPVPPWVKTVCCGPQDVHHLRADQVKRAENGDWIVDIYPKPIPKNAALPSQDGDFWVFFAGQGDSVTPVRCFFAPMAF